MGTDETKTRMEIIELENHPYYVGVQYHPEYLSRPLKPSPPFMGLILASVGKLQSYLNHGCRLSPRVMSDISSGETMDKLFKRGLSTSTSFFVDEEDSRIVANGKTLNGHCNGTSSGTE